MRIAGVLRWRWRRGHTGASHQVLPADGRAEVIVVRYELFDEFMQAALENLLHPAVLQPRSDRPGLALGWALPAVGGGDGIAVADEIVITACERPRHLRIENEKVGDQPGLQPLP